jgi:hypothetical protein
MATFFVALCEYSQGGHNSGFNCSMKNQSVKLSQQSENPNPSQPGTEEKAWSHSLEFHRDPNSGIRYYHNPEDLQRRDPNYGRQL